MKQLFIIGLLNLAAATAFTAENHSTMMNHQQHSQATEQGLSEAGNDAFGTIQEVITKLNNDPSTDWSKVNIEALRLHLIDMHDMTFNVEVISQQAVANGLQAIVKPTTTRAALALQRVFSAHPAQLKRETGWNMQVKENHGQYTLIITTEKNQDIAKLRGLGYIGLMAYGNHHQPHHWAMATGKNPHHH